MERLTHPRSSGIKTGYWSPNKKDELVARLAEYEDTGVTPQEIYEMKAGTVLAVLNEDGVAEVYDDTYDITIHCDTEEEQKKVCDILKRCYGWIPVLERLPENDDYVLISFENFSMPLIGRYEIDDDGSGSWYLGDCDEDDTCISNDWFVNAWMPLPEPYRSEA